MKNSAKAMTKRLLIDVNSVVPYYAQGRLNGIGRTTLELVRALNALPPGEIPFDIQLYSQNMKGIGGRNIGTRFESRHLYLRHTPGFNRLVAAWHLRECLTRYDLMHIPSNYAFVTHPERCIVTVHDAMFFTYPEEHLGHANSRRLYTSFARKAKAVLTCSENSKREIAEYMDVDPDKIHVAMWGVDRTLLYPHKTAPCKYTGGRPYFLSVSCDKGRKNTISVVRAYARFAVNNPDHHLVLVWRNPSEEALAVVEKSRLEQRVHFVSEIPSTELAELYAGASATFFPSRYEGFGLPVAESQACGTPVVTCDNSSLREVGGDAALYVEPQDIDAMARWMEYFENGDESVASLRERSYEQSKPFTWESCARKTLNVYRLCLDV